MFINVCVKTFVILKIFWKMAEFEGGYFCPELNGHPVCFISMFYFILISVGGSIHYNQYYI